MIRRRSLMGGLLAMPAMPAIIRTPGLLMMIKPLPQFSLNERTLALANDMIRRFPMASGFLGFDELQLRVMVEDA